MINVQLKANITIKNLGAQPRAEVFLTQKIQKLGAFVEKIASVAKVSGILSVLFDNFLHF